MNSRKFAIRFTLLIGPFIYGHDLQAKNTLRIDSIGVENNQGKQVILHQLAPKETYYSLGRKYGVPAKDIMTFNQSKPLKIGNIVKIPTSRTFFSSEEKIEQVLTGASVVQETKNTIPPDSTFTRYKVGAGETLYTIAKRFQVSVEQLIESNNLNGKTIQKDQLLKIPQSAPTPKPVPEVEVAEEEPTSEPLPTNRYGLRQISDRGIGVWMEGLNTEGGKMLALHKTAPIGTVIKITNPMTHRTTFAKVVGKYTDNSMTRDAVIVISKAAANQIGIIDKRFLVNISYGVPNE